MAKQPNSTNEQMTAAAALKVQLPTRQNRLHQMQQQKPGASQQQYQAQVSQQQRQVSVIEPQRQQHQPRLSQQQVKMSHQPDPEVVLNILKLHQLNQQKAQLQQQLLQQQQQLMQQNQHRPQMLQQQQQLQMSQQQQQQQTQILKQEQPLRQGKSPQRQQGGRKVQQQQRQPVVSVDNGLKRPNIFNNERLPKLTQQRATLQGSSNTGLQRSPMSTSRSLPGMIQAGLSKTEEISSRDTEKSNVHVYEDLEVLEKKLKDDSIIADLMEDNDWGEEDDKLDRDDMEDGDGEEDALSGSTFHQTIQKDLKALIAEIKNKANVTSTEELNIDLSVRDLKMTEVKLYW